MKSLAFRAISGAIAASALLVLPVTATATASALLATPPPDDTPAAGLRTGSIVPETAPNPAGDAAATATVGGPGGVAPDGEVAATAEIGGPGGAAPEVARSGAMLRFRLVVPGATAQGVYEVPGGQAGDGARPGADRPGADRSGAGGDRKPRVTKPDGRISITLKVGRGTRCGVLQTTTNGPADGIEWYTFGVLCKPGTATFRTEANRLPWSAGTLPSVRLCNGLSPALAEGDECDGYEPPRSA